MSDEMAGNGNRKEGGISRILISLLFTSHKIVEACVLRFD